MPECINMPEMIACRREGWRTEPLQPPVDYTWQTNIWVMKQQAIVINKQRSRSQGRERRRLDSFNTKIREATKFNNT